MNVASLELCKELYKLSGWYDTFAWYEWGNSEHLVWSEQRTYAGMEENTMQYDWDKSIPAYDLGYLLRNLPTHTLIKEPIGGTDDYVYIATSISDDNYRKFDTPEDAICKLAIELFKKGILTA